MPLTTTTVAANLPSTVDVAQATVSLQESPTTAVASASVSVARSAVARVDLPAQASPWAPRAAPKMTVSSAPTVPAMVQTSTAMAPTRTAPWREVQTVPPSAPSPVMDPTPLAPPPKTLPSPVSRAKLEVSSAQGASASAKQVSQWLAARGVRADLVSTHSQPAQKQSVIYYQVGHSADANRVAKALPFKTQVRWAGARTISHEVLLVLGQDGRANVASAVAKPRQRPPTKSVTVAALAQ